MGGIIAIPAAIVFGIAILNPKNFIDWCKRIISYIHVEIDKRTSKKRFDLYDYSNREDPRVVNFLIPKEEYNLESPQPDSYLLKAEDEVFFHGTNSKSELLVVKISRRWNNRADACVYMKLANGKIYELVKTSDFQQSCTDDMTFSCGGLQLQCSFPMRSWRIFYAGYLREISGDNPSDSRMVYVKFALLWKAASDVHDFQQDIVTKSLASGLSKVSWKSLYPHITESKKALDFYGQTGTIHGKITVENEIEDHEVYLFGHRIRYLGNASDLKDLEFRHTLGYVLKNGTYLHLGNVSSTNIIKNYHSGYVVLPGGNIKDIYNASISVSDFEEKKKFQSKFNTDLFNFTFNGSISKVVSSNKSTKDSISWIEFELNGEKGYGIQLQREPAVRIESQYSEVFSIQTPSVVPPVVSFKEDICQLPEITGGKGSSLGKLTQLSKEIQTANSNQQCFTVPNGIVVTTSAYENFLTKNVLIEIKTLEDNLYKETIKPDDVKKACGRVSAAIIETEFPSSLEECIRKCMEANFGEKIHSEKFAVRSSATGEDTEQMSAAGQMETFLGVSGFEEILLAVKKCWASQFSFIAIEYKRRYGQNLNSPMAVVIQEMISCDIAGVLFTCDPLTGNPTLMSITANYGLGESVVSGSEEPDMIQLKRDIDDEVSITSISVGAKSHKIIVEDKQGTNVSEVPENERSICSLSEENAIYLANLAIKIEKYYRSRRDIEWGFCNNNLYIFQSRPVTSGTNETVFEIEHEFDSSMRVENDFFSVSNVGEVFPGALSPLGMTVLIRGFGILQNSEERVTDMQLKTRSNYFPMGWLMMSGHTIFNVADIFHTGLNDKMSVLEKATIISFFGRMPENEEMMQVAQARYGGLPQMNPLLKLCKLVKLMLTSGKRISNTMDNFSTYRIPIERYNTAKELCNAAVKTCWDICDVLLAHMLSTQISSVWNMIIFSTLGAAQGDFDDTVYRDFSMLVKTDIDVESADVPSAMQKLALQISKTFDSKEFKKLSAENALEMLKSSNSEAGEQFRAFLEKHGHRCLQEFDIYSRSWGENPESLVKLLQNMCGSVMKDSAEKKQDDLNELISKISVPLTFIDKLKLKFILPLSRKAVQRREMTKSMLVKFINEWRKAYRKLAQLMVQEGRIPEEDLLYFMTIEEVTLFLENNSPKIIAKATQRKRRFPVMHKYRFPEIMKGFPRPIDDTESPIIYNDDNFSMKGIPVSQGVAKGFIRKALNLEEAEDIQHGEILLTYSTDIAWTPYFPQLAGVVTELGGLISHGAVVSREYGIPCIAGLHGATKNFQTGDYVLLDGNKGILKKIKKPDI